ncbi:Ankyrin repeat and SOCS box protein 6 [Maublancomyces gigas]|uniref:Ankyrin repeat and SOCS box protein 6 n=1 Tax=Discina gigas TaxID=1032678 RepID=A0ABR3GK88_9PEZI
MSILDLSYELLFIIADYLTSPPDIHALLLTHRGLAHALSPALDKLARDPAYSTAALFCYVAHGNATLVHSHLELLRRSWQLPVTPSFVTAAITAGANYSAGGDYLHTPPLELRHQRALHWATTNNKPHLLTFLLSRGATISYRDPTTGGNALDCAITLGNPRLVSLLLRGGADATAWEQKCGSLLHCTILTRRRGGSNPIREPEFLSILSQLCDAGADIQARDELGHTALHLAVLCWRGAVRLLLRHGADVNARDEAGNTPLHLAALRGACVDELLAEGADPAVKNHKRLVPACLASRAGALGLGIHKCGKACGVGKNGRKSKGKGKGGPYEFRLLTFR